MVTKMRPHTERLRPHILLLYVWTRRASPTDRSTPVQRVTPWPWCVHWRPRRPLQPHNTDGVWESALAGSDHALRRHFSFPSWMPPRQHRDFAD